MSILTEEQKTEAQKICEEYNELMTKLREQYAEHEKTVTVEELEGIANDLHHQRVLWLTQHKITEQEIEQFFGHMKSWGPTPVFKMPNGATMSFARADLGDLLYIRHLTDEELVNHWKSISFCITWGGVSIRDLQVQTLYEMEMDNRPELCTEEHKQELREWYEDMEKHDPYCPESCNDCMYDQATLEEKKETCTDCPNSTFTEEEKKQYKKEFENKVNEQFLESKPSCDRMCEDPNNKYPNNCGYAGTPKCPDYKCDHNWEPTDNQGHNMQCTKCGEQKTLGAD